MTGKRMISMLLLLTVTAQAGEGTIVFAIQQGKETGPCAELVERFLDEYREVIPHSRIVLDGPQIKKTMENRFELRCNGGEERIELKGPGDESYRLRYQRAAQSFDAADWVPLQKRMREQDPGLGALAPSADGTPVLPGGRPGEEGGAKKRPWWPWVVTGVLAAGAAAAAVVLLNQGPGHTHVSTR
jgi:hypothetical protein